MTIRKHVTIERDGVIEVRDPSFQAGAEVEVMVQVEPVREKEPSVELTLDEEKPLWQKIVEIGAAVPPEEWEKVPRDLSMYTDHYLYGAPREDE
ncbi:MAG TPA: hypothetical protein VE685_03245 [Thermoanaerobaculia bacterium]|nr:hypothetical protein [Thermoanaerobaculia bacterium]